MATLADPVAGALARLRASATVEGRIVHEELIPANAAQYAEWPAPLDPRLLAALDRRGIDRPYIHQAEAIEHALAGRDVVVVTPTASGKTLAFAAPVLDAWLHDPDARSLWLFPTKALAQDQLAGLQDLAKHLPEGLRAATYDGDTAPGLRRAVRNDGNIVVTNPDMLHSGILPHHTSWVRLFQHLRYIVIDELHAYRGLFGSHLANVLRRLLRLCRFYGSNPTVIACSATIANPRELAEKLLERPVHLVDRNGAPRAARRLWFWNPPLVDGTMGVRRSATLEARRLMTQLLTSNLQTIAFARSRSSVEVLLTYLQRLHPAPREGGTGPVRGYRGGYLPLERRAIEAGLRDGSVRGVVSTNALELGIDIGNLDAAILVGYPGSIASTWQQLGRAGRRNTESLGVFIATDSPLDQFLVNNPRYVLEAPPEHGLINPDNLLVLGGHLQAAAFELAFETGESFGEAGVDTTGALLDLFRDDGLVHRSGSRYHWAADAFPAEAISLRRAAATNVVIIDTSTGAGGPGQGPQGPWAGSGGGRPGSDGRVIGEVDQFAAPVLVHDDAIYLHEGRQFHVERLDWEEKRAYVHPVSVDHFTLAETRTTLQILERYQGPVGDVCRRSLGEVRVSRLATIYKKVRFLTQETIGAGPITLPEQDLHTIAAWTAFDPEQLPGIDRAGLDSGLSGLAAVLHSAASLLCMCDPRDIGAQAQLRASPSPAAVLGTPRADAVAPATEPQEFTPGWRPSADRSAIAQEVGWPTVYIYDSVAGGVGFAERCHERSADLVRMSTQLVTGCGCETGCPSCVGPSRARVDGKSATLRLLDLAR
ncbi:MAG: DEAD/DEAH box helicase [Candidatus Dormibacteraeota bacterium]|uniref:ATP-dependent helicase n=1 Tax=Candidatus Aeolococcus gillhamiae TaxID=3127015 RepID=A0A2W5Z6E1_9BACT|nr:DEAD/DEAH box helicase [Candidatus Dormibacteraeota bacterium]PZR80920.1 MAG: ATP-dependent helicase [Candidatus Dormibacter sp. RRmetagenome_bin12]